MLAMVVLAALRWLQHLGTVCEASLCHVVTSVCAASLSGLTQDSKGVTPLMRLLQKRMWQQAGQLLSRGNCNINAKVSATATSQPAGVRAAFQPAARL